MFKIQLQNFSYQRAIILELVFKKIDIENT